MGQNNSKSTVSHGNVNSKSISLARFLIPSWKSALTNLEKGQAKDLLKKYAPGRDDHPQLDRPTAALGSEENIYSLGNCGLFAAVLTAYNNHWNLRTSPDDWWFCVIRRVACAIDRNAKKESVRKMFVDHEGKKDIVVVVPDDNIYTVDYSWFFDQMVKEIQENVKVPEIVDGVTADFSTTTPVQKIVSQITLMYSLQEYFTYGMCVGCGIPAVEMLGTEDDWSRLTSKLKVLRTLLEPIENDLGLESKWWDLVEKVFSKLLDTYQGKPDREWWGHVISYKQVYSSGFVVDGAYEYGGWIIEFLENTERAVDIRNMTTGVVSVPLNLKDPLRGNSDKAILVAGMLGFTFNNFTVQPFQGWTLLLSKDSPFCKK